MNEDKTKYYCPKCDINCTLFINGSIEPGPDVCPFGVTSPKWTRVVHVPEVERSCKSCRHKDVCLNYFEAKSKWFYDLKWTLEGKIKHYSDSSVDKAVKDVINQKLMDTISSVLAAGCRYYDGAEKV